MRPRIVDGRKTPVLWAADPEGARTFQEALALFGEGRFFDAERAFARYEAGRPNAYHLGSSMTHRARALLALGNAGAARRGTRGGG